MEQLNERVNYLEHRLELAEAKSNNLSISILGMKVENEAAVAAVRNNCTLATQHLQDAIDANISRLRSVAQAGV